MSTMLDTELEPDSPRTMRIARTAISIALILLGWAVFHSEQGQIFILGDVDTAVHEAGHLIFRPFGTTMWILGGSLFQVVFPLVFAAYFWGTWGGKERDIHAGMVCLWWSSINMVEVSVYMADSRAGQLMLLTGMTRQDGSPHDWHDLLIRWHALDHDTLYAARLRSFAAMVCVFSIGASLYATWADSRSPASAPSFD